MFVSADRVMSILLILLFVISSAYLIGFHYFFVIATAFPTAFFLIIMLSSLSFPINGIII